jgi:CHAT domain-containing protein
MIRCGQRTLLLSALVGAIAVAAASQAQTRPGGSCGAATLSIAAAAVPIDLDGLDPEVAAAQAERRGDRLTAAALWREAARHAASADERALALGRAAELRASLGFDRDAQALLEEALGNLGGERPEVSVSLRAISARIHTDAGRLADARADLDQALASARSSGSPSSEARVRHALADLDRRAGELAAAQAGFEAARDLAARGGEPFQAAQSEAELLRMRAEGGALEGDAGPEVLGRFRTLSESDAKARLLIHLGKTFQEIADPQAFHLASQAFAAAAETSAQLGASESESFALGYRAALYESRGRLEEATRLTERAVFAASNVPEARYRFDAQLAHLYEAQGERAAALAAYRRSLRTLDRLRDRDGGRGLAFDRFVEPVFLSLVDLLLQEAESQTDPAARRALLTEARDHIEALKSVEITDHFQDACLVEERRQSLEETGDALIVYPILLPDRTALILSRGSTLWSVTSAVTKSELEREVGAFRIALQKRSRRDYLRHAARLYDWLIRPFEDQLGAEAGPAPDALVFVPAGALRTIPMASLYDREGRSFLIEKTPVAIVPALTLTEPRAIERENLRSLLAGLTEAVHGFPALENVESEIDAIETILSADEALMDEGFVTGAVASALSDEDFGIVHIASHGRFESESADSFLLTYDGELGMDRLATLIGRRRFSESPVELLTLSACETAVGDERSALGLAGVAVRAGARSALATLWTVNDQAASELIAEFYRQLVEGASRAEALRRAQLSLLASRPYRHPGYWSPFVLISNWM